MSDPDSDKISQPVFHGSPPAADTSRSGSVSRKTVAAGVAFGIGSAAIVAALLYARRSKAKGQGSIAGSGRIQADSD